MATPVFNPSAPFTPAATGTPSFDPSKPFEEVVTSSPAPAPATPSPEDPNAPKFDPSQPSQRVYTLDDFKATDEKQLDEDKDFSPVQFGLQYQKELRSDPQALEKLTRLYTSREKRGTTLKEKAKAILKGTPEVLGALGSGLARGVQTVMEQNPIAIAARVAGAASTGLPGAVDKELQSTAGELQAIPASVEAAVTGSSDLVRRSAREVKEGVGKIAPGVSSKEELTQEEWRNRLFRDVAGLEQAEQAGKGSGVVTNALGLDAGELKKAGIEVNPGAIQELSVISDPVNFIPMGAAVGAVAKIGGKLTSRVVATALSAEQAAKLAGVLNKATEIASKAGAAGDVAAGKVAEAAGHGLQTAGAVSEKGVRALGGTASGVGLGALLGGDITSALGGAAVAKGVPRLVTKAGKVIEGAAPSVPQASRLAREVGAEGLKGVGEGLLLGIPFSLGARPEEEQYVLGAAGVAGLTRAGLAGGRVAGRAAQNRLAESLLASREQAPIESPGFGTDAVLDQAHERAISSATPEEQALVNRTRELFRNEGAEVYLLDDATFNRQTGGNVEAHGFFTDIGTQIAPDGSEKPLVRVFLNKDAEAVGHEIFHALRSVDPELANSLVDDVKKNWTPEQKAQFKDIYEAALNGGKPRSQWTRRISDEMLAEELASEVFSRVFTGTDLSGVAPSLVQRAQQFGMSVLEKLGVPLRSVGGPSEQGGRSTLRVRGGTSEIKTSQNIIRNLLERVSREPEAPAARPEVPVRGPEAPVNVAPEQITPRSEAPARPAPAPARPAPAPAAPEAPRNIRATRANQNDFAVRRAEETGVTRARRVAEKATPEVKARVEELANVLESGRPVVELTYRSVKTPTGTDAPAGRTLRRSEQEAAYIAEGLGAAPESIREAYQKVGVVTRLETTKDTVQAVVMSLDKVIANVHRVVKDAAEHGVESKIPYEVVDGKLTDNAWGQIVDDLQAYSANQANGFRGDGRPLVRPAEDIGASIPGENTGYNPTILPEDKANFLNLTMGLNPPLTSRAPKAGLPANVKGQILAEAQGRTPQTPSVIRPQDITKQNFKNVPGRSIKETNPLRNELAADGVKVRELIEVTERINLDELDSVNPRPDLNFAAPVTDIIRAGFLPREVNKAVRSGFLPDSKPSEPTPSPEIRDLATSYAKTAGIDYRPSRNYAPLDADLGKRLADYFEATPSSPEDPAVQASYQALANEVLAQYRAMEAAGYKIEPFEGKGEPYKNSAEAVRDIRENKHLYFLQTENAFGMGDAATSASPMLADSGVVINGKKLVVNDIFRAVHDFFGHGKEGYQFGPRGEFNAWRAHSEMFSPEAQGALAAETLAQNSWVNFGKHLRNADGSIPQKGEAGYIPPQNRPFGEQKNIVIPDSFIQEARTKASAPEGKFLPEGQSVEEFGRALLDAPGDQFKPAMDALGGLTNGAWDLGWKLKSPDDVAVLKRLSEEARERGQAAMKSGDFNAAMPYVMKGQFFREAYEAATGSGSVATAIKNGRMPEGYAPPFPDADAATPNSKFLPKTSKGKELAEQGYDFRMAGNPGARSLTVLKDGVSVGEILTRGDSPRKVSIASSTIAREHRGKGLGEAAYRELLANLKDEGIRRVSGTVVAPQPIAIRRKIFGDENTRIRSPWGEVSPDQALAQFKDASPNNIRFFEVYNEIRPDKLFLPEDKMPEGVDPIVSAAIRTPKGRVFTGAWHGEALERIADAVNEGTLGESIPDSVRNFSDAYELGGFGTDGFVTKSGKFLNRKEAFDHAEKIKQLRENPQGYAVLRGELESEEFSSNRSFLPKEIKRKVKRDAQNRPLTKDGLVDYELLYREMAAASKAKEKADMAELARNASKYKVTEDEKPASGQLTGWVLPDDEFVPLDTAFHEEFLAKNAAQLNADFGTKLSGKVDPEERFAALQKGFVRVRYTPNDGTVRIEAAANRWTPKAREALLTQLEQHADSIDRIYAAVMDEKGNIVDSVSERVMDLEGAEKLAAFDSALSGLKAITAKRDVTRGPGLVARARAFGEPTGGGEGKFLPKTDAAKKLEAEGYKFELDESADGEQFVFRVTKDGEEAGYLNASIVNGKEGFVEELSVRPEFRKQGLGEALYRELGTFLQGEGITRLGGDVINPSAGRLRRRVFPKTAGDDTGPTVSRVDPHQKFLPKVPEDLSSEPMSMARGWLSPEGKFYPLGSRFQTHDDFASALIPKPGPYSASTLLQDKNWLRVVPTGGKTLVVDNLSLLPPTAAQKRALKDWAIEHGDIRRVEFDNGQRVQTIFHDERVAYLPKEADLFGREESADTTQREIKKRVAENKLRHPEARVLEFQKDDNGDFVLANGKPRPIVQEYAFMDTPLAKEAAKGVRGEAAREDAYTTALADRLVNTFKEAQKNPDVAAGVKWYSTARTRLKKIFGDDTKLFAELLGATSARTAVDLNFNFALDAYNQFKSGAYDALLAKYREGKRKFDVKDVDDYVKATKDAEPTRAAFLDWWIEKHNLTPLQSNGKKFGMNSRAVLKVLDGSWRQEVQGPKTPNFTGNLTGETFEATIDVWAARMLHRLSNEGNPGRWRILPGNETGVSDADFFIGQSAFRKAADQLKVKPDALQAILWFAEKDHWERNGWTDSKGAEKSDFNTLLARTERTEGGRAKLKTAQTELSFDLGPEDIKKK